MATDTKHTPGPWEVGRVCRASCGDMTEVLGIAISSPSYPLFHLPLAGRIHDVAMADARLMASAPDLLAVCKEAEQLLQEYIEGGSFDFSINEDDAKKLLAKLDDTIRKATHVE